MLNKGDHILVNFKDEAVKGCVTSINDSFYGVRITNSKTIWPKHEDILQAIDLEDLSIDEQVKTTLPIHGIPVGSVVTVIDLFIVFASKNYRIKSSFPHLINSFNKVLRSNLPWSSRSYSAMTVLFLSRISTCDNSFT